MSLTNPNNKKDKDKKKAPIPNASKFGMTVAKGAGKSQTKGGNNAAGRSMAAGRGS